MPALSDSEPDYDLPIHDDLLLGLQFPSGIIEMVPGGVPVRASGGIVFRPALRATGATAERPFGHLPAEDRCGGAANAR